MTATVLVITNLIVAIRKLKSLLSSWELLEIAQVSLSRKRSVKLDVLHCEKKKNLGAFADNNTLDLLRIISYFEKLFKIRGELIDLG